MTDPILIYAVLTPSGRVIAWSAREDAEWCARGLGGTVIECKGERPCDTH